MRLSLALPLLALLSTSSSILAQPTSSDASSLSLERRQRGAGSKTGGNRGGNGGAAAAAAASASAAKAAAAATASTAAAKSAAAKNAGAKNGAGQAQNAGNNNGGNNNGGGNIQTSLTLDKSQVQSNLANDGQNPPVAGQVASLTSTNNFINFCATTKLALTNGLQVVGGSCNPTIMGAIVAQAKAPSCKFSNPKNGANIAADTTFTITMNIKNLQTGAFTNAQKTYFGAPAQLNGQGILIGHSHVVVEAITALDSSTPADTTKFAFFKGLNDPAVNGVLSATVTGGLPAGVYKMSSINSASNHQPALVGVAQHGSLDDAVYFTVRGAGNGNNNGNNDAGNTNAGKKNNAGGTAAAGGAAAGGKSAAAGTAAAAGNSAAQGSAAAQGNAAAATDSAAAAVATDSASVVVATDSAAAASATGAAVAAAATTSAAAARTGTGRGGKGRFGGGRFGGGRRTVKFASSR